VKTCQTHAWRGYVIAMAKAKLKLVGLNKENLDNICKEIVLITKTMGVAMKGPVPLPTKKLIIPIRRTPCGDGSDTYEHWDMRVHKRLIEVEGDERVLRQILRIKIPDKVHFKIKLE